MKKTSNLRNMFRALNNKSLEARLLKEENMEIACSEAEKAIEQYLDDQCIVLDEKPSRKKLYSLAEEAKKQVSDYFSETLDFDVELIGSFWYVRTLSRIMNLLEKSIPKKYNKALLDTKFSKIYGRKSSGYYCRGTRSNGKGLIFIKNCMSFGEEYTQMVLIHEFVHAFQDKHNYKFIFGKNFKMLYEGMAVYLECALSDKQDSTLPLVRRKKARAMASTVEWLRGCGKKIPRRTLKALNKLAEQKPLLVDYAKRAELGCDPYDKGFALYHIASLKNGWDVPKKAINWNFDALMV